MKVVELVGCCREVRGTVKVKWDAGFEEEMKPAEAETAAESE